MATTDKSTLYDELLDLLTEEANGDRLAAFRLPPEKQNRLELLLKKNADGSMSADERAGSKADQAVPAGTVWQGDRNGCRYRCAAIELKQLGVDRWITLAEEKGGG